MNGRRKTGRLDLEAIEMAVRSAMHQAGAAALTELLQFPVPAADQRTIACSCGHRSHYRELCFKTLLTAVGKVEVSRPYYLCSHCHVGQFPADVELDVKDISTYARDGCGGTLQLIASFRRHSHTGRVLNSNHLNSECD